MTSYNRNPICPACHKRRNVLFRSRTHDYRCRCGRVFRKEESENPGVTRTKEDDTMGRKQKVFTVDILNSLQQQPKTMDDLAYSIWVSPRTLRVHIHRLVAQGIVTVKPDFRDLRRFVYCVAPVREAEVCAG